MEKLKELWAKLVEKVKQHKKEAKIGAAAVAAILIGVLIYNHNNPKYTVDVSQVYEISCSGHNEVGKASISQKTTDKKLIQSILYQLYPKFTSDVIKWDMYESFFDDDCGFNFNKEDNISNGDNITATFYYDKAKAKNLKLKFKNTTLKTTASDLPDYIMGITEISDTLQNNLDKKAKEKIDSITSKNDKKNDNDHSNPNLSTLWYDLGGSYYCSYDSDLRESITLAKGPELKEKYIINSKTDPKDLSSFIYIYEITISGPEDYHYQGGTKVVTETTQKTGYVAIKISSVKIDNDNITDCTTTLIQPDYYYRSIHKSFDEAKKYAIDKLDQDKYDIEQL